MPGVCNYGYAPLKSVVILEVENHDFTVQRCLKCQVALLLIWICSVGSGTSIIDGWMTCDFTSFLTVFQSYQENVWMIMKGCVQWNSVYG